MKDMFEWWNLIYWIPLSLALLWVLLMSVTGHHTDHGIHGHAHAHTTDGIGHAGGVHHTADAHWQGHGADYGHGGHGAAASHGHGHGTGDAHEAAHHGHGHGAGHAHGAAHHGQGQGNAHGHSHDNEGWSTRVLHVLGIGRVPLTLVMGIWMIFWGAFGLSLNLILRERGMTPATFVIPSLGATFVLSVMITRLTAGVVARFMPTTETFAISNYDLLGREGVVVYSVTEKTGTIHVTDAYGTVHRRMARTQPGGPDLKANTPVVVIGLDDASDRWAANDRLIVEEFSDPLKPP